MRDHPYPNDSEKTDEKRWFPRVNWSMVFAFVAAVAAVLTAVYAGRSDANQITAQIKDEITAQLAPIEENLRKLAATDADLKAADTQDAANLEATNDRVERLAEEAANAVSHQHVDINRKLVKAVIRLDGWVTDPVRVGYGDGAHILTERDATCPLGTFVAGIVVHYGGTCNEQCNADGGIIRKVELMCRPL